MKKVAFYIGDQWLPDMMSPTGSLFLIVSEDRPLWDEFPLRLTEKQGISHFANTRNYEKTTQNRRTPTYIVPMVTNIFRGPGETVEFIVGIVIGNMGWLSVATGAGALKILLVRA